MALSSDLISQFVKVTNDVETDKPSNTVYGTVVEYEGEKYVRIDGSERLTRAGKVTDAEVNDRVVVTIENHTATITGNISSPSARSQRVEDLGNDIQKVAILVAGKVSTEELIANYAKITDLTAQTARIDSLVAEDVVIEKRLDAAEAVIVTLDATYATIDKLESEYATIEKLESEYTTTTNLEAKYATISKLESDYATIAKLESDYIKTTEIDAKYATIAKLENEYASIAHLTANYATAIELQAVYGKIGSLDTEVADINTLIFGSATGNVIQTNFANAVIAQLGDAQIKSAMIKDISAAKITSGDIITDNVNVKSQDGRLLIADQTIQISDTTRVRVQIGKDASGDYSINIWDANGKLMFSEGGLTEDAVKEQIIRNDMVKDDANISASKLDIDTLFEVINEDGSHTLKSSKVKLDEEGQTLDVAFKSMTTKIDGISVGGRNLLLNTGRNGVIRLNTVDAARYLPTVVPTNVGGLLTLECSSLVLPDPEEIYYRFMVPLMAGNGSNMYGLEIGETYTLSGKAKVSTTSGVLTEVVARSQDRVGGSWSSDIKTVITETDSDEWISFKSTFTIRENAECCYTSIQVYYEGSWTGVVQLKDLKFEKGSLATDWTPAPEDVDAVTTELSTKYHDLTVNISTLSSTIGEQSQLIDKKADGSTVTALSTKYSTLEQTVNGLNATVASHTTQIVNKADGSTVTALSEQYASLSTDLSGFKTTVKDTYTTKTEFDKLSVGGRNLLKNTKSFTGITGHYTETSLTGETHQDFAIRYLDCTDMEVSPTSHRDMSQWIRSIDAEGGGQYTFSFYAKGTKIRAHFYDGGFSVVRCESSQGTVKTTATDGAMDFTLTNEWKRYWVVYKVEETNTQSKTGPKNVLLRVMGGEAAYACGVKFEKGNKPTDWTPAPEDIDTNITKSAETVTTQTAELLGSYATKVDLTGYYTKSQTESAIEQKADSITSTVAAMYSTKAELAALDVIGRNLLINTGQNGTIKLNAANNIVVSKMTYTNVDGLLTLDCSSASTANEIYYRFMPAVTTDNMYGLKKGVTYTLSGKAKVSTTSGMLTKVTARFQDYIWSWGNETSTIITETDSDVWIPFESTFTIRGDAKSCYTSIQVYFEDSWAGVIQLKDLKFEKGNKATDWTPAPEDVATEFGNVRSEIQQLADSISLSVTGSLGQSATIKLTADGQTTAKEIDIDMSKVRQAFANDPTAITVEAGTVTFNAGTLLINASNFTLDGTGNIVAKSGAIGGMTLWANDSGQGGIYTGNSGGNTYDCCGIVHPSASMAGLYALFAGAYDRTGMGAKFVVHKNGKVVSTDGGKQKTEMTSGGLDVYYNTELRAKLDGGGISFYYGVDDVFEEPILCGTLTSELIEDVYQTTSMILRVPYRGVIEFVSESTAGGAVVHYKLHDRPDEEAFNREDYKTFSQFFLSPVYIGQETYFHMRTTHNNWMYIKNRNGIGWYTSDGDQDQMISMGTDDIFVVGSTYHTSHFKGDNVHIVAKDGLYLQCSANRIIYDGAATTSATSYFYPDSTGTCYLGTSDHRWKQLAASTACSTTSDIRVKENIVGLSDIHSELFDRFIPVQYNRIDGDNRIHYGFVAQQVASAMAELGIDEDELALVQHDHWVDRNTNEYREEYSMVYDNFIAMLVHEVQKLKREIKTLKGE